MTLLEILKQYVCTSHYGNRTDPIKGRASQFHTGIDFRHKDRKPNDIVESFCEGDVIFAGEGKPGSGLGGFGWVVLVKDREGYVYMYAHLAKNSLKVKTGDHVVQGQALGIMGSTGLSTGIHLHFEVRKKASPSYGFGTHTNPMKRIIELCQDGWTYYNNLKRKDMCDLMHETAEFIRDQGWDKEV